MCGTGWRRTSRHVARLSEWSEPGRTGQRPAAIPRQGGFAGDRSLTLFARSPPPGARSLKLLQDNSCTVYHLEELKLTGEEGSYRSFPCFVEERRMHAPIKYFEKGLSIAANGAWFVFNGLN